MGEQVIWEKYFDELPVLLLEAIFDENYLKISYFFYSWAHFDDDNEF